MKSTIDAIFPVGRFDSSFFLSEGNRLMYDFMGPYIYSSLYKMVNEEDMERLKDAFIKCHESEGVSIDLCIHVINAQGGYDKYIVNVQYGGDPEHSRIEFQNTSDSERKLIHLGVRCSYLENYLTLCGKVYLAYWPEKNDFVLFWQDYEQIIEYYHMPLAEWADLMVQEEMVTGRDKDIFCSFCEALRVTERDQVYTFHGSILARGETMDAYKVYIVPRLCNGEKVVLGTWSVINEHTGNDVDEYIEGKNVDSMTRILNKGAITEYAEEALKAGGQVSIVMMDIDNFKTINDTYGHMFGDQVIIAVADVIKGAIGKNGAAGRVGGDEYMLVIKESGDEAVLRNYLRTIKFSVWALFQDKLGANRISCSIGAARSGIDSDNFKELLQIADKALYIAKQKGKNRFIIYMKEKHGEFHMSGDNYDMMEIRDRFYTEEDLARFNELMGEVVLNGSGCLQTFLEHTLHTLEMDRLVVAWKDNPPWVALGTRGYPGIGEELSLLENERYLEMFHNDEYGASNITVMEYSLPEVFGVFKESGVRSFRQYLMRDKDGELSGTILIEECTNMKNFPKLPMQLFRSMCKTVNAVLVKESMEK